MRIYYYILFILFFSFNILMADDIYLKNGKIIQGEVLRITEKNVEYREYNGLPFLIIPIDQIDNIVYLKEIPNNEPVNSNEKLIATETKEIIYQNRYLDSYLRFSLLGGMSFVDGNITDKEQKVLNKNKSALYSDDGSYSLDYYSFQRGFELAGLLPALIQKAQTSYLTGTNIGLKTRYTFTTLDQEANSNDFPNDKYYSGILLKYYTISAGPEINLVFSKKSSRLDFIFQIYTLVGYIPYGKLTAATCVREGYADNGGSGIDSSQTKARFTGNSITGGMGFYWSINTTTPIILGFNIFYSQTEIKFNKAVPVYDGAKRSSFNEKGILLSIGTHFWNVN